LPESRVFLAIPVERNQSGRNALVCMEEFEHRAKPPVTREERLAKLEKRRVEGEQNMAAIRKEDAAFMSNFERLKAERKAREQLAGQKAG